MSRKKIAIISFVVIIIILTGVLIELSIWRHAEAPMGPPGTVTVDQLLSDAQKYHGQVVRVFGRMSDLGLLRCPCFRLDGKPLVVWYLYNDTNIYPSQVEGRVQNGDLIVVTGRFHYQPSPGNEYTIYAETIEKP